MLSTGLHESILLRGYGQRWPDMIQVTPQMRILVAVEPADFRKGINGLARVCREVLCHDPFSGYVFVFGNRRHKAIKILVYDGQGTVCESVEPGHLVRVRGQAPLGATVYELQNPARRSITTSVNKSSRRRSCTARMPTSTRRKTGPTWEICS